MNDEINEKSINLAVQVAQVSGEEIKKALEKLIPQLEQGIKDMAKSVTDPELKHGKMTLKQLSKQKDGLSTMELTDPNLRILHHEMKKHNMDFAAVKDGKGKYTLFFKGKDADSMTHAFKQYTQKVVNRAHSNKPSIGKTLAAAKKLAQALGNQIDKVKNRDRGARGR